MVTRNQMTHKLGVKSSLKSINLKKTRSDYSVKYIINRITSQPASEFFFCQADVDWKPSKVTNNKFTTAYNL